MEGRWRRTTSTACTGLVLIGFSRSTGSDMTRPVRTSCSMCQLTNDTNLMVTLNGRSFPPSPGRVTSRSTCETGTVVLEFTLNGVCVKKLYKLLTWESFFFLRDFFRWWRLFIFPPRQKQKFLWSGHRNMNWKDLFLPENLPPQRPQEVGLQCTGFSSHRKLADSRRKWSPWNVWP